MKRPEIDFFSNTYQISDEQLTERQQFWLELIATETTEHCKYLESIGWADRASHFKVKSYIYRDNYHETIDIGQFNQRQPLPDIVRSFDVNEKNTLFANCDSTAENQAEEIQRTLYIRLYPTLKRIITEHGASLFLGSNTELQAYTASVKEKLFIEIEVPSSVKFYISMNSLGNIKVYISGLVGHENLIQQLITLKLAGIDLQKTPIFGNTERYLTLCNEDLLAFEKQASTYLAKRNVLIVSGCGLENTVCATMEQHFNGKISLNKFHGQIVSLTYVQSPHAPNLGFIVLNLNYGEICEAQVSIILEKFNCIGIFTGSAAGFIPANDQGALPEIGSRLPIHLAKHYSGEIVNLSKENNNLHLQVPTIFMETFDWLENAKKQGSTTVDVETFYIARAVQKYRLANPHRSLYTDIGVFISDYVGEKPLRSYHNVFDQYPSILQRFIKKVLVANSTLFHNNNILSIPCFSGQYFGLTPHTIDIRPGLKAEAVVDSIGKFWDKSEFSRRVHTPVTIGKVKDTERFIKQGVQRCIHLPIKLPGSDIRIPIEYQHFTDELEQILNFEASINPEWGELYAYLTVDQGFVPRANSQRVPGPHVDGIPRDRKNLGAQIIDHAYLVTNAIPTMFYMQQFNMNPFDPNTHHFFAIFRALADESRTIMLNPFEIALMDAYSVHTPTQTLEDVNRTFIRLEFSTLEFDRTGNSINTSFSADEQFPDYPFNYKPRPIPEHLFVPPSVYLDKPITNQDYLHESIDRFGRANLRAIFQVCDRFRQKQSDYKDLNLLATEIMNEQMQGFVLSHHGIPHAFSLYKIENKTVKLYTLFTLNLGKGQEVMLYMMKILKDLSDRLSIQAGLEEGATPITIIVNENNEKVLKFFLRAAQLTKIGVTIERLPYNNDLSSSLVAGSQTAMKSPL